MDNVLRSCYKCGQSKYFETPKTFKNGTIHIELRCVNCNAFNGFKPQHKDPRGFEMPIGKYKGTGMTLQEIWEVDLPYLEWAAKNMDKKFSDKIKFVIDINAQGQSV